MRFLIQSVESASVYIQDIDKYENISNGMLIYVGVSKDDMDNYYDKIKKFVSKFLSCKCLKSEDGSIASTIKEQNGEILLISNFTLYGDNTKGTKINFGNSASYNDAEKVYNLLIEEIDAAGYNIKTGMFGAMMEVESKNLGPINYVIDL